MKVSSSTSSSGSSELAEDSTIGSRGGEGVGVGEGPREKEGLRGPGNGGGELEGKAVAVVGVVEEVVVAGVHWVKPWFTIAAISSVIDA